MQTTSPANATIEIQVNGRRHRVQAAPETPLLYVLRNELALNGPKFGCGLAQCGACTVHLGGEAVRACMTPVSAAARAPVTTVEGLSTSERPHALLRAFEEQQAAQCGYCISGMIMTAAALLAKTPTPTDAQLRAALAGNLCRCGSHLRILRAVAAAARSQATPPRGSADVEAAPAALHADGHAWPDAGAGEDVRPRHEPAPTASSSAADSQARAHGGRS